MNYFVLTFGCQMNQADSEKIHLLCFQAGLKRVLRLEDADILLINTCSVRQKGEDRVFWAITQAKKQAQKQGKNIIIGVTGCMIRKTGIHKKYYPKKYTKKGRKHTTHIQMLEQKKDSLFNCDDKIFLRSDFFDFVFRIEEVGYLTKILSVVTGKNIGGDDTFTQYLTLKQKNEHPAFANVIIQTGCDNFCTFCIVPYTRGRETSREKDEILEEVQEKARAGCREITLLGQNVNSYGKEKASTRWDEESLTWKLSQAKTPFRDLLNEVDQIPGIDRIRFTSSNPHDMTKDILDAHFELSHTCYYLHFALQSWDNDLLQKMHRKHQYEDFKTQCEYLRGKNPLFSISTDIIVWFPGESEEQFQNTLRAFEEITFDFAYIARYSERLGTTAQKKFRDDIPAKEKARRWDILNQALYQSIQKRAQLMLGRQEVILITQKARKGGWVGRTRNFKEVFLLEDDHIKIGDLIPVEIREIQNWILIGKRIQ